MDKETTQPVQQLTLQEQLAIAQADWDKANDVWEKAEADWHIAQSDWRKAYVAWGKAEAEIKRMSLGGNTGKAQRQWVGLTAEQIASIPLNEHTLQTAERLLKDNNA